MSAATVEDLEIAQERTEGRIPPKVIEAFLPAAPEIMGQRLVPLTLGHELVLSRINHPLAKGGKWEDVDVLTALFVFSRSSRELFALLAEDRFEPVFFEFVDGLPMLGNSNIAEAMVSHWARSKATALSLVSPHSGGAQKKTAVSDGGSELSAQPAASTGGLLTWLRTMCRWLRS
jgi:hypothetical protein